MGLRNRAMPLLFLGILIWSGAALAQGSPEAVGVLGPLEGEVGVLRPGEAAYAPARLGQEVFRGDRIRTGRDGKVQILFLDDTMVVLGTQSELEVHEFFYRKEAKERKALLGLLQGKLRFLVTRFFVERRPDVQFRTSTAVVGVRGTEGILRMVNPVSILCLGGALEVLNPSTGQILYLGAMHKTLVVINQPMVLEVIDPRELPGLRAEFQIGPKQERDTRQAPFPIQSPRPLDSGQQGIEELAPINEPTGPREERPQEHYK